MGNQIRPLPLGETTDAYASFVGQQINNNRLMGGKGVTIRQHGNGTSISVESPKVFNNMNFTGQYDPTAEYNVNDVVVVDPNINYNTTYGFTGSLGTSDVSGSSGCPMCPGTYVCVNYVPAQGIDYNYLLTTIYPLYSTSGGQITEQMAESFRHYQYNVYYPIYPNIPSSSISYQNAGSWYCVANQTYWIALMPMLEVGICNTQGGSNSNFWVAGMVSASFNSSNLPYSG